MQDFCKGLYRHLILETMLGSCYSFSPLYEQRNNLTVKDGGGGGLVPKSCPTLALQFPLSMGFSRQE